MRPGRAELEELAEVLRCLDCGGTSFAASDVDLVCGRCGWRVVVRNGVPSIRSADEDPAVTRERETVRAMGEAPIRAASDFTVQALLADTGEMREAFASLPYDDGSVFYRDSSYFRDVATFAADFDYVTGELGPGNGGRLLDVGADLTWSTARLAAHGWRPLAIDINDHLAAAQVLRRRGPWYGVLEVDMHLPVFRDGAFDAITAFNALHHTHRIEPLIAVLAAALEPGGRLGIIEPYWFLQSVRDAFGAEQIAAGINENVYRLEEWHRLLVNAGLELRTHVIAQGYDAVYVKRDAGQPARHISLAEAEAEIFADFYGASLDGPTEIPGDVPAGATVLVPIAVTNRARHGWSSDGQLPVRVGYRLHARASDGCQPVSLENPRALLGPPLLPGGRRMVRVPVVVPERPGDYAIEFDLVHEHRTWFSGRGLTPVTTRIRVVG